MSEMRGTIRGLVGRLLEWSGETFGPGRRTDSVIAHIRKELIEIEEDPTDVTEWIDVAILALDGAWRSIHSPDQLPAITSEKVTQALLEKLERNFARQWPDWRTSEPGQPIEHIHGSDPLDTQTGHERDAAA